MASFENGSASAVDLVDNAAAVARLLAEVLPDSIAPGVGATGGSPLSKDAAFGLFLVLTGVENTLNKAATAIKCP